MPVILPELRSIVPPLAMGTSNRLIGFSAVETLRVEAATAPVFQMLLLFDLVFFGMEEHAEKLFVAAGPAYVFRGTASRTVYASCGFWRGRQCEQFFERYLMRPVVTKIVDIVKAGMFAAVKCEIPDANVRCLESARLNVIQALAFEEISIAVAKSANEKIVKVTICPAKGRLQNVVELSQVRAQRQD